MKFHEWGERYGPIYQVNLAGTNHVWITRDSVARDLLSKRSANYSERPFIPALEQDNRTSGQYLPLMSRNDKWTRQRKFAKQIMDDSQKAAFYGYPELESIRLLFELMTEPARYNDALESFIARVTSRLAWGTSRSSDELKQRARELLIGVSPTGSFANKLPLVMSLPEKWTHSKSWELRRSRTERKFFETMQHEVAQDIKAHAKPVRLQPKVEPKQSWTRMFLDNKPSWGFANDLEGAYAVGMHGIAGALTIAAPMQSFCLAMCHYPQYQPVLHEEIDRICGDRQPSFSDMPDMPVLRAFIRETMRWRPPVPTGIPHESVKDDIYEGYHIPAGSVMHPLEWSISRDPDVFPDPDAWNPLRWLDSKFPTYQEPLNKYPTITSYSQFGYGRRTCQGMGVTEADLFVGLGSVAWLFSMHADTEDVEAEMLAEDLQKTDLSVFTPHKESVRSSFSSGCSATGLPTGMHDPLEEDDTSQKLQGVGNKLMQHANDSAISIPGEFPEQQVVDPPTPPRSPDRRHQYKASTLAGKPEMARVTSMFASPPTSPSSPRPCTPRTSTSAKLMQKSHNPSKKSERPEDPTMNFTTLLIAKPLPFKFNLRIRNQDRADKVARQWMDLKMEGEFEDSKVYWEGGNNGDAQYGWGETFS